MDEIALVFEIDARKAKGCHFQVKYTLPLKKHLRNSVQQPLQL